MIQFSLSLLTLSRGRDFLSKTACIPVIKFRKTSRFYTVIGQIAYCYIFKGKV